jgi:hypothetical protein
LKLFHPSKDIEKFAFTHGGHPSLDQRYNVQYLQ